MNAERSGSNGTWVFIPIGIGLLLVLLAVSLPSLRDIKVRPHAVERHGQDAIDARVGITNCKAPQSRWISGGSEGTGWAIWCETGESLCPGMYITAGGIEKTAFIRPCYQWRGK